MRCVVFSTQVQGVKFRPHWLVTIGSDCRRNKNSFNKKSGVFTHVCLMVFPPHRLIMRPDQYQAIPKSAALTGVYKIDLSALTCSSPVWRGISAQHSMCERVCLPSVQCYICKPHQCFAKFNNQSEKAVKLVSTHCPLVQKKKKC